MQYLHHPTSCLLVVLFHSDLSNSLMVLALFLPTAKHPDVLPLMVVLSFMVLVLFHPTAGHPDVLLLVCAGPV